VARHLILDTAALIAVERGLTDAGRTAATHARLLAHVRRSGRARGVHHLIIAAQAAEHEPVLVSPDLRARFGELPGVQALAL
jgi:predicted nucleic acid-binding protein